LQVLIDSYIREEIYYREAIALGLDRNDTILRRRMMQKMEFLTSDLADLNQPDEATISQYFQENLDKYELPARISFSHIYFSAAKRGEQIYDDVEKTLVDVGASNEADVLARESGDSFMYQHVFTLETPFEIVRLFGQDFAESLFQLQINSWQGPVESGYGLHLVRVNEKIDASFPELASVIDLVRNDWMLEQRQRVNKEIYERFRQRYEIVVEDREKQGEQGPAADRDGKSS
jgi:parvulin-like peptidyl-prolyl isomerase